tara:strand:- start:309 stop:608 length:300 start_codon:yes stop_codon:yes gene_type:complete
MILNPTKAITKLQSYPFECAGALGARFMAFQSCVLAENLGLSIFELYGGEPVYYIQSSKGEFTLTKKKIRPTWFLERGIGPLSRHIVRVNDLRLLKTYL